MIIMFFNDWGFVWDDSKKLVFVGFNVSVDNVINLILSPHKLMDVI